MKMTVLRLSDWRMNAIWRPSGDQAGLMSFAGWVVNLRSFSEPITFT